MLFLNYSGWVGGCLELGIKPAQLGLGLSLAIDNLFFNQLHISISLVHVEQIIKYYIVTENTLGGSGSGIELLQIENS